MKPRRVVIVAYDGTELLDVACLSAPFDIAGRVAGERLYDIEVVSPGGRPIACDAGLVLGSAGSLQRTTGRIDTMIVVGGTGHETAAADIEVVAHVRRLAAVSRRVASVCTGATILAATGLLDGRRATTHWKFAGELARRFPAVRVDPDPIYIREGDIYTAAGTTSALDLALAFVQDDHGDGVARIVSRGLVTYLHRPGNQAQMSMYVATDPPDHQLVAGVVEHVRQHLDGDLDTATLGRLAGVSERQLGRLFVEHVGQTPGRFVRRARTEAAAALLSTTELPVALVARQCGFHTAETLRQAFVQHFGTTPSRYRSDHTASRVG